MALKFNKNISLLHDFNLDLHLYDLKNKYKKRIRDLTNKNINFIPINKFSSRMENKIEIYWGNRPKLDVIKKLPNLKWIHLGSVGFDEELIKYLKVKNITISNSYNISNNEISQSILSYILYIHRGIHVSNILKSQKKLLRSNIDTFFKNLKSLKKNKILIIGFGRIGRTLVKYLHPFSENLYAIENKKKINSKYLMGKYKSSDINSKIRNMDIVVNLLPFKESTKNYFDDKLFKKFKKNSIFICAGRGDTYNINSLLDNIRLRRIAFAYLDTFPLGLYKNPNEPISNKSSILRNDRITVTPHTSSYSHEYWERQVSLFSENLSSLCSNKKIRHNAL